MKKVWNVLIFPGGTENGIEIYNSLSKCKNIRLFSVTSNVENQAFYIYKKNHVIPEIYDRNWVVKLNDVIVENNIDLIFPSNSLIIDALSENKKYITCDILLPDEKVLEVTRSKKKTIQILKNKIPCPEVYKDKNSIFNYPVFAKPDKGYGSQNTYKINNKIELDKVNFEKYIVEEFLPGKEYTVDCFSDSNGRLLFSSARERSRIRMGTSMHARDVEEKLNTKLKEYAEKILDSIKISGAWFFQVKEDNDGCLRLLEIDVRIAGTMCFNRCKGVNFPLLSIYQHYGLPFRIMVNEVDIELDRCLKNRYRFNYSYDTVYIDLDDTIIFNHKINTDIVKFLYQCRNNGKKIVLLSKNLENDKNGYLRKFAIFDIFDEIFWLEESEKKSDYIHDVKSIFIDDSFSQRKEVAEKCNIPTLDSSMIECLLDDRI